MASLQATLNQHLARQAQASASRVNAVKNQRPQFPAPERKASEPAPEALQITPSASTTGKNYINRTQADDIEDYLDTEDTIKAKVHALADLIRAAKSSVVYTGAGISTSASIPDYRSKQGVWTMREKGMQVQGRALSEVEPTVAHRILTAMVGAGRIAHVVSTNIDGLHMRSGLTSKDLTELHGNSFLECCENVRCKREYFREFVVAKVNTAEEVESKEHRTGRLCDACQAPLRDAIVHFGEMLQPEQHERAFRVSHAADLALCLGTSLRVSPACNMPRTVLRSGGKLIVVNLQKTPFEDEVWLHIFAPIDQVMTLLAAELAIPTPQS